MGNAHLCHYLEALEAPLRNACFNENTQHNAVLVSDCHVGRQLSRNLQARLQG